MYKIFTIKHLLKGLLNVTVITVIVSLLVSASYHYLGPLMTITLVAVYAALAYWMHFAILRVIIFGSDSSNITEDSTTRKHNDSDIKAFDGGDTSDKGVIPISGNSNYDVVQVYEPEYTI